MVKRKRQTQADRRPTQPPTDSQRSLLLAYGLTVSAVFAASFFPEARIWGLSGWAYFPLYTKLGLVIVAGLLGAIAYRLSQPGAHGQLSVDHRRYIIAAGLLGLLSLGAYVVWRSRYHFLGDGYMVLKMAAEGVRYGEGRAFGAPLIGLSLRNLLPGEPLLAALRSFQIVAVLSGIIAMVAVRVSAIRLFADERERFWFFAALLTCGFALLYFGYVEYYALFVTNVLVFALTGLLIARNTISRYWILLPLATAVFLHIMGVTLVPAAVYLLLSKTGVAKRLQKSPAMVKTAIAVVTVGLAFAALAYSYYTSYYFRFAIYQPWPDRFTPLDRTVFAPQHLADLLNLIVLLVPGVLVLIVAAWRLPWRRMAPARDIRFLLVCAAQALAAALLFEAKFGLARDWDLFAFVGPPVAVLLVYAILRYEANLQRRTLTAALATALAMLSLGSRAVIQTNGEMSLNQYVDYIHRDHARSRNGFIHVTQYYQSRGETRAAAEFYADWEQRNSEIPLIHRAKDLRLEGRLHEAIDIAYRTIALDPRYADGWSNLGEFYLKDGNLDSALAAMRVAAGLNPGNASIENILATCYFYLGDLEAASRHYHKAAQLEPNMHEPWMNLAAVANRQADSAAYLRYLTKTVEYDSAPADAFLELADYHISQGNFQEARKVLGMALVRGADREAVQAREQRFPVDRDSL